MSKPVIELPSLAYLKGFFEKAVAKYSKMPHILCIHECTDEEMALESQDRLERFGLTDYKTIVLESTTVETTDATPDMVGGKAVPVVGPKGRVTAIFLRKSFEYPNESWLWMAKCAILFHELGHAKDFKICKVTDLDTGRADVERAEQYADDFAEVHLREIKCNKHEHGRTTRISLWEAYHIQRRSRTYHKTT